MFLKKLNCIALSCLLCVASHAGVVDLFMASNSYFSSNFVVVGVNTNKSEFNFAAGGIRQDYTLYALQMFPLYNIEWKIDVYTVNDKQLGSSMDFY